MNYILQQVFLKETVLNTFMKWPHVFKNISLFVQCSGSGEFDLCLGGMGNLNLVYLLVQWNIHVFYWIVGIEEFLNNKIFLQVNGIQDNKRFSFVLPCSACSLEKLFLNRGSIDWSQKSCPSGEA